MPSNAAKRRLYSYWESNGVDIGLLNQKLPRSDRETAISFIEVDTTAEITTASPTWQNRIESLGIIPASIMRFSSDKAEIRYYNTIPVNFIKLPSRGRKTSVTNAPKNRRKAAVWKKMGVKATHDSEYKITKRERETAINFMETHQTASVYTANTKWQNRIESLGFEPTQIDTFMDTGVDIRTYTIPVEYIKMPSRGRGRPPKVV